MAIKPQIVSIRLSLEDLELARAAAARCRLGLSTYGRAAILAAARVHLGGAQAPRPPRRDTPAGELVPEEV